MVQAADQPLVAEPSLEGLLYTFILCHESSKACLWWQMPSWEGGGREEERLHWRVEL